MPLSDLYVPAKRRNDWAEANLTTPARVNAAVHPGVSARRSSAGARALKLRRVTNKSVQHAALDLDPRHAGPLPMLLASTRALVGQRQDKTRCRRRCPDGNASSGGAVDYQQRPESRPPTRRPATDEASAADGGRKQEPPQLQAWRAHVRSIVEASFDTHRTAAAQLGLSPDKFSRRLNAKPNQSSGVRMPERGFVDELLDACAQAGFAVTHDIRRATRALYMEALAATDSKRHRQCRQEDDFAATQIRCEELTRALADLEARNADLAQTKRDTQQAADVASTSEALTAERDLARRQRQEAAAQLAAAQTRITELTTQLALERQQRQLDQQTVRALHDELLEVRRALAHVEEEQSRHQREEAVLAEALAVTERALAAEPPPSPLDTTQADAEQNKPVAIPITVTAVGFLVMILGMVTLVLTMTHPDSAAAMDSDLVDALRGNTTAGITAASAAFLSFAAFLGGFFTLVARGAIPVGEASTDDSYAMVTWI